MTANSKNTQDKLPNSGPALQIVGLGGAGLSIVDKLAIDGMVEAEMIGIHTDQRQLDHAIVSETILIGKSQTHGLGSGGDPEIGKLALEEMEEEIKGRLKGSKIFCLCVGMGGGTGSGAAGLLARWARELGAFVIVLAVTPFEFEGKRRLQQSESGLRELRRWSHILLNFENDRMGELVLPKEGIAQAFAAAETLLSGCVQSISEMLLKPALIPFGIDDLLVTLGGRDPRCLFGRGEADGDNRAYASLESALQSPLLGKKGKLSAAEFVLVHVSGGESVTLYEVQILMRELQKHLHEDTQLFFGASVDAKLGEKMRLSILSSVSGGFLEDRFAFADQVRTEAPPVMEAVESISLEEVVEKPEEGNFERGGSDSIAEEELPAQEVVSEVFEELEAPAVEVAAETFYSAEAELTVEVEAVAQSDSAQEDLFAEPAKNGSQQMLEFEPKSKGRFDKSEPTVIDGEDLDVPTFMRQ